MLSTPLLGTATYGSPSDFLCRAPATWTIWLATDRELERRLSQGGAIRNAHAAVQDNLARRASLAQRASARHAEGVARARWVTMNSRRGGSRPSTCPARVTHTRAEV